MAVAMTVSTRDGLGCAIVAASGDVDISTSPDLREALGRVVAEGNRAVVVDLSAVKFIDSTGLGVLIGTRRRTYDLRGSFSIVCENQRVLRLLDLTSLDKVFTIHAERDEATARPVARTR